MESLSKQQTILKINDSGSRREAFVFVINFNMDNNFVIPVNQLNPAEILISLPGFSNFDCQYSKTINNCNLRTSPISFSQYEKAFDIVKNEILAGNTYLLNLTFPTEIHNQLSIKDVFFNSYAPYKLWINDLFTVYSPEIFIKIDNGIISSYPMKGTIDAAIPDAENIILNDVKETAEHNTIVDLIRNDLSLVAKNVYVKRFRYIDEIKTTKKNLLQVSSEIAGELSEDYYSDLGNIIFKLLPAGSVTGAPKKKTVDIILNAEGYSRGFYTGIFGYFDGKNLDSAVMIRFIEKTANGRLFYKSGGGITSFSCAQKEYNELIDKVYVPVA